jgi:predicted ATPase
MSAEKENLENVANTLTDDVLTYWSQNKDLRVQPEVTQRTEQRQDGQHSVLDELKIRIWDNRHSLSLPFDEHSAGFQWFFSFLAAFSEYEHRNPPAVILLDEPAVGLHAKARQVVGCGDSRCPDGSWAAGRAANRKQPWTCPTTTP